MKKLRRASVISLFNIRKVKPITIEEMPILYTGRDT
jgi:hypothetical protein